MAGNYWKITTPATATTTSTLTMLQIISVADIKNLISYIMVTTDGIVATSAPITCRVLRQTTAIGGVPVANNPVKNPDDWDESITASVSAVVPPASPTSEPTAGDVLEFGHFHPQGMPWIFQPSMREHFIAIGGGDRLGIELTAGVDVNALITVYGES